MGLEDGGLLFVEEHQVAVRDYGEGYKVYLDNGEVAQRSGYERLQMTVFYI